VRGGVQKNRPGKKSSIEGISEKKQICRHNVEIKQSKKKYWRGLAKLAEKNEGYQHGRKGITSHKRIPIKAGI